MALTAEEKAVDTARLERLIMECMAALRGTDAQAKADALDALTDFQTSTTDMALIQRAASARAAGANQVMEAALKQLTTIVSGLDPLGSALADAAAIAKSGKAELLFPRLAASAETMLQLVTELKKTADTLKKTAANVKKLGDVPDAIDAVKTALDALKAKTPQA